MSAAFLLLTLFLVPFAVFLFDLGNHLLALGNLITLRHTLEAVALERIPDDRHDNDHGDCKIEDLLIWREEACNRQDYRGYNSDHSIDLRERAKIEWALFSPL